MSFLSGFSKKYISLNRIELYRERLLFNFDFFKTETGVEIWPVLKSNAYGHGIKQVAEILEKRKFEYLVVDGYQEVLEIRKVSKRSVLMIGAMRPENFENIKWKNLAIMVQDKKTIKALGESGNKVTIHLKVNTGMNRQGIEIKDLRNMIYDLRKYKKLEVEGLMSHLAGVDDKKQIRKFEEALKIVEESGLKIKYAHLAATNGVGKIKNPKINAVRLGIGLYGINVLEKQDKYFKKLEKLRPVLSFKSCFTTLRRIKKGERVGYGGTWQAKKDSNIGVIPVGYNEGLDRRLSNNGYIKYKNKFYPIIGRICMNLAMVDLGNTKAKLFDKVEIISNSSKDKNSIKNMAKQCETIPYDLLVKVNSSVRRVIV